MHRLALAPLALALVSVPAAAHAATMTLQEAFTVSGNTTGLAGNGFPTVSSTSFNQFNPLLGTLNSITLSLSGTATSNGPANSNLTFFLQVDPSNDSNYAAFFPDNSNQDGLSTYAISASGTTSTTRTLNDFEGTGTEALLLVTFGSAYVSVPAGDGTLTYNYTPAGPVAVTPEPSSLALLGTGVLSIAGVLKRRLA